MKLSEHFDTTEFEHGARIPDDCLPLAQEFCEQVLEPIRALVNEPMEITSGYRTAQQNFSAHGQPTSKHLWTPRHCAADFRFAPADGHVISMRIIFDLIRTSPTIPFYQVILEHGALGSSIIHVSYSLDDPGVRMALEGAEHNASPYTKWQVADYNPPQEEQA